MKNPENIKLRIMTPCGFVNEFMWIKVQDPGPLQEVCAQSTVILLSNNPLRYPSEIVTRKCDDDSTGNLCCHIRDCKLAESEECNLMERFSHSSTYTAKSFRYLLVKWITSCSRPYAIVDDIPLQEIFKMLYSRVHLVSGQTISCDVRLTFKESRSTVINILKV